MMTENPYAAPVEVSGATPDTAWIRLRSVARVFKIVGWCGVVMYVPIVITCVGSLLVTLLGHRIDSPLVLAGASAFNGMILALAICYVMTGRRIHARDLAVRRRAILLSCLMMLGFPIFTIVGVICYRNLKHYFNESGAAMARP